MCMGVLGMLVNHKRRRCDVSHESYSGWYLIEKEGSLALVLPYPPIRQQIRYVCEMLLRVYGCYTLPRFLRTLCWGVF